MPRPSSPSLARIDEAALGLERLRSDLAASAEDAVLDALDAALGRLRVAREASVQYAFGVLPEVVFEPLDVPCPECSVPAASPCALSSPDCSDVWHTLRLDAARRATSERSERLLSLVPEHV